MKVCDINSIDFNDEDLTFHLTNKKFENSISSNGLEARIGDNSSGNLENEKTEKVFFTKSLKGTLIYLNRTLNIIDSSVEHKRIEDFKNGPYNYFIDIYNKNCKINMTREDEKKISYKMMKEYLNRSIIYKCNLNYSTKKEYNKMDKDVQNNIDYLLDDVNESQEGKKHTINNMHTISGKGISKEKMEKLIIQGSDSALDITKALIEKYKELYPNKDLPVLDEGKYAKDYNLLEEFYIQNLLIKEEKQTDFLKGLRRQTNIYNEERFLKDLQENNNVIKSKEQTKDINNI